MIGSSLPRDLAKEVGDYNSKRKVDSINKLKNTLNQTLETKPLSKAMTKYNQLAQTAKPKLNKKFK